MSGAFIVLEGIDGTGKSSVSRRLREWLESQGREVVLTAEPTQDWLGMAVRRANQEDLDPRTESLLFTADRCQHTLRIREWVRQGKVVICDRYFGSTVAYQGAALEGSMGENAVPWLLALNGPVALRPDLTVLLISDPRTSMRRIGGREELSKFEKEGFLGRVQGIYLMLADESEWEVVDSDGPLDQVVERVMDLVKAYV
ncbi:MAG: putative thymidylate kinase [Methanomassiliicoccales archaeon PtaB.Bin134]|mgnify:FL=1|jgi:dTMP kinase|nr:MAG: putative thymidylate kinase [Methanomassiliicoccales archaeon PtaB.Bin134]